MPEHEPRLEALGWAPWLGKTDTLIRANMLGRYPVRVQKLAGEALAAFTQVMLNTGYENPCDYIGSYNLRLISGSNTWSSHGYGLAIDFDYGGQNPDSPDHVLHENNPHLHRAVRDSDYGNTIQLLKHQVEAVEAIKNKHGEAMWLWLGHHLGDSMHFQINVRPERTDVDWSTVIGADEMCPWNDGDGANGYDRCDEHFYPETAVTDIIGTGIGENQGMCAVPEPQQPAIQATFDERIFHVGNGFRYHYDRPLSEGRWAALNQRS